MTESALQDTLNREKESTADFEPLPFYYFEISQVLLRQGEEFTLGVTAKVHHLLREIRKLRLEKLAKGLRDLEAAHTVRLPHVSAREFYVIRAVFLDSLRMFEVLDELEQAAVQQLQSTGGGTTQNTWGTSTNQTHSLSERSTYQL